MDSEIDKSDRKPTDGSIAFDQRMNKFTSNTRKKSLFVIDDDSDPYHSQPMRTSNNINSELKPFIEKENGS